MGKGTSGVNMSTNDEDLNTANDSRGPSGALYEKSLGIIREAMKDVKQEILIKLEDGSDHIVYIHDITINSNSVSYDFSTPSEDRKDELTKHVEHIIQLQMADIKSKKKMFTY